MKIWLKNYTNQRLNKSKIRKVYAKFKGNIWAVDLAEMGLLSFSNHVDKYSLCVIDFPPNMLG